MSVDKSKKPAVRVFVTKYALTQGVFEIDAEVCEVGSDMIRQLGVSYGTYYHKGDYAPTADEAIAQVQLQVERERKSIAKKLAKLDKIDALLSKGELPEEKKT